VNETGWWTTSQEPALIPPPVVREVWNGKPIDMDTVTSANESEYVPSNEDDPIGAKLRVAHAYGIDILDIELASSLPLVMTFQGDHETAFRTVIVSEADGIWTETLFSQSISFTPTEETTRLRIVVTRSEPGTGTYSIAVRPGT